MNFKRNYEEEGYKWCKWCNRYEKDGCPLDESLGMRETVLLRVMETEDN